MKSIRSKIFAVVISGMLLIMIAVAVISAVYLSRILNKDSDAITNQFAETESGKINDQMVQMEYTVKMMENFAIFSLDDPHLLSDEEYCDQYVEKVKQTIISLVGHETDGVASYFFRINPEISTPTSGFFIAKRRNGESFEDLPITDLSNWEDSNNNIAWYSEPVLAKKAVWIMPYDADNNHTNVITYSAPIYKDGVFCGVIGMEIEFSYVTTIVDAISVYDNGFAYLTDGNHNLIYSPVDSHQLDKSHTDHGYAEEHRDLKNGMHLIIHVDYADMQRDAYRLFMAVLLISILILIVFIAITMLVTRRIIRPLKELADSADHIVDGKYDYDIDLHADEEILALGSALKKTADKVSNYMNYINALAYRDALTGVKNATAYNEMTVDMERRMRTGQSLHYAILVADINFLKVANDMYGHDAGNQLIISASKIICSVFKHSPVFRIGGDEFVVLLENEDLKNIIELLEKLDQYCNNEYIYVDNHEIPVSVARGVAEYNCDLHTSYADVFDRADREMYIHKDRVKHMLEEKINNMKKSK